MRRFDDILRAEIKPRDLLLSAHSRHQTDDPPAPGSWLDLKNARNLRAWQRKYAQRKETP